MYIFSPFGVGSSEFITLSPSLTMDFVSANKIHRCIAVSRPGIDAHVRLLFNREVNQKKKTTEKKIEWPPVRGGKEKNELELRAKRRLNDLFQNMLGGDAVR